MFDYIPEYANGMKEEVSKVKNKELKSMMSNAIEKHIYRSVAEKYDEMHDDEEVTKMFRDFCSKHKYLESDVEKIFYLLEYNAIPYGLDIVYDIVNAVEKEEFARYKDDNRCLLYIFENTIQDGKKKGCCYKPTFESGSPQMNNAIVSGMCCALCRHYENGKCHNHIYSENSEFPDTEPWQICECILFDGRKYGGYSFDGSVFVKERTKEERENFAQIASETIDKMKNSMLDNENFINFIKEEIPDIYEQLKANYEKAKGVSENG